MPLHKAREGIGSPSPNHSAFTAKPSSHHVCVTLRVTPFQLALSHPFCWCRTHAQAHRDYFSMQSAVWCNQMCTIKFKGQNIGTCMHCLSSHLWVCTKYWEGWLVYAKTVNFQMENFHTIAFLQVCVAWWLKLQMSLHCGCREMPGRDSLEQ